MNENFGLKRDLAYEKKKYMDLMNAFLELRNSVKKAESSLSPLRLSNNQHEHASAREEILVREKIALEQTLMSLSEEVETLSKRNE